MTEAACPLCARTFDVGAGGVPPHIDRDLGVPCQGGGPGLDGLVRDVEATRPP